VAMLNWKDPLKYIFLFPTASLGGSGLMGKILLIYIQLNFTPNTLGCYGLIIISGVWLAQPARLGMFRIG